jgi:hypothetical protein
LTIYTILYPINYVENHFMYPPHTKKEFYDVLRLYENGEFRFSKKWKIPLSVISCLTGNLTTPLYLIRMKHLSMMEHFYAHFELKRLQPMEKYILINKNTNKKCMYYIRNWPVWRHTFTKWRQLITPAFRPRLKKTTTENKCHKLMVCTIHCKEIKL